MDEVTQLAQRFAALGHEARLRILRQLLKAHPDGLVVGALQSTLEIPGSTLTHHLDALHQEGLITKKREGRFLRYRAAGDALRGLLSFLYAECCAGSGVVDATSLDPSSFVPLSGPPTSSAKSSVPEANLDEEAVSDAPGASWRSW